MFSSSIEKILRNCDIALYKASCALAFGDRKFDANKTILEQMEALDALKERASLAQRAEIAIREQLISDIWTNRLALLENNAGHLEKSLQAGLKLRDISRAVKEQNSALRIIEEALFRYSAYEAEQERSFELKERLCALSPRSPSSKTAPKHKAAACPTFAPASLKKAPLFMPAASAHSSPSHRPSKIAGISNLSATCYLNAALQQFFSNSFYMELLTKPLRQRTNLSDCIWARTLRPSDPGAPLTKQQDLVLRQELQRALLAAATEHHLGKLISSPERLFSAIQNSGWNHAPSSQEDSCDLLWHILDRLEFDKGLHVTDGETESHYAIIDLPLPGSLAASPTLQALLSNHRLRNKEIHGASPKTLVLHIPRSQGYASRVNLRTKKKTAVQHTDRGAVSIPELLSLREILPNAEASSMRLNSITLQSGTAFGGHYTALVRAPDGSWVYCNDSSTTPYASLALADRALNFKTHAVGLNYIAV